MYKSVNACCSTKCSFLFVSLGWHISDWKKYLHAFHQSSSVIVIRMTTEYNDALFQWTILFCPSIYCCCPNNETVCIRRLYINPSWQHAVFFFVKYKLVTISHYVHSDHWQLTRVSQFFPPHLAGWKVVISNSGTPDTFLLFFYIGIVLGSMK